MTVLEISGKQVFVKLEGGMSIWIDKAMLKQYGVKASDIKVGAKLR